MIAARKVKDLTTNELKMLIRETVSEAIDPSALKESMEILSDENLFKKIKSSVKSYKEGKKENFVSLKEIKKQYGL